jgi:CheY-like chemotaxis protein
MVLEDQGAASHYMEEALQDIGHVILEAGSILQAQSVWERRSTIPIHCIIADLNMPTTGMTRELSRQSIGGKLAGWVWLKTHVLGETPDFRQRVILYSDYLEDLKANASEDEISGLRMVPKRGRSGPADQVMRHVDQIAKMTTGGADR